MEGKTSQTVGNNDTNILMDSIEGLNHTLERMQVSLGKLETDVTSLKGDVSTMSGRSERV